MARAREFGLEVALDLAFQCAPDHPYVSEHKEWFRVRPDGSVQYAENPPKKYQDIYPLYFENEHNRELREELRSVVRFWIEQDIHIFRVDNPHTKPFDFWEWLIADIKTEYPEVLFLSEAFTRPKVMYRLSQMGFTQSYTYFAWRNTKSELTGIFHRAHADGGTRIFPPKPLAQHSGHTYGIPPIRRSSRFHDPIGTGSNSGGELWNLRTGLRAL